MKFEKIFVYGLFGALAVSVSANAYTYNQRNAMIDSNQCEVTEMRITNNYVRQHRITEKDDFNILLDPPVTMEYRYSCADGSIFWKEI